MFDEPSPVFADFGKPASLRKADGSSSFSTTALYDEVLLEEEGEHNATRSRQPQITTPKTEEYEEGDYIDYEEASYEILDAFSDNTITIFRVVKIT